MKWRRARQPARNFSQYTPVADLLRFLNTQATAVSVNRRSALSVPAVQRGRNMLCAIATLPLEQHGPNYEIVPSALLRQLDPDVPNVVTLAQTVEDLLFDGIAWWRITAQDFAGFPVSVRHINSCNVSLQPPVGRNPSPLPSGVDPRQAVVYIDGKPVPANTVIRFDSPNPAVLRVGVCAIQRAILLDRAASMYADDPRPLDYFTPGQDADPVDDDDVKTMLAQWKAARKERSTAYIPASLVYHSVDTPSPSELQLVELQRQAGLEIANALGIDPEDLGISTTSRTYSNDVDRRRNKLNEVLAPFMRAITDRLSMGDVTRRGYTVCFDTSQYLQPNPTDRWATYQTALAMGAITVDEIREKEGMTPLPAADEPAAPEPEPVEAARPASRTFGEAGLTFVDVPVMEFSVNREGRTIEGLALPYNRTASQGGLQFRFNKGSLQWDAENPGRVKLLRDHDITQPLGKAIQLKDTPRGLLARFKVAQGAAGDEALSLAEDGVLDGLSVGVDFSMENDVVPDPKNKNVLLVNRADWRETSLTAMPSFDDARVTSVAASRTQGETAMPETTEATEPQAPAEASVAPAVPAQTFSQDDLRALVTEMLNEQPERQTVDPTRPTVGFVQEPLPYRFDRQGRFQLAQYDFATDVVDMLKRHDFEGTGTDSGKRVMATLQHVFSIVSTGDASPLNPTLQRPDLYAGPQAFKTPIWDMINKGALPNNLQPFTFPVLPVSGSSIVVSGHSEGVEPPAGDAIWTNSTVTPTALSGKTTITREVWDMGGNPAVSNVLMQEFLRSWFEGLETASATHLNTLTGATDINLGAGVFNTTLANNWNVALAGLQFVRSYNFSSFAMEQWLYTAMASANDETGGTGKGRPLFPMIGPTNTDGTAEIMFRNLNLGGVVGIPCWALTAVSGSANNSWLFDADYVHGWASGPQTLQFAGSNIAGGGYAPVANIDIGVFGYKAFVCRDINAVRQVIYDNT